MALSAGTRLGAYEILSTLGAGGMGEVYRARDTRLGREVAIKLVLEAFLSDRDRLARFEREARALAAINHPNIATLYGIEEADAASTGSGQARHFLVMELVEGPTLGDELARGPMSLERAVATARQIAEALEAAHDRGIIHRDLKPANIKITPDDKVKVLDFGLAKAAGDAQAGDPGASPSLSLANSPTLTAMGTQAGMIIGTASYMSPEQARGGSGDHRSDVFSFGVVFYEMLTGRQPFQGETVSDVLASVLAREPDLAALPGDLAPRLSELLKRCLDKHPKRRWQAIGDVRHELEVLSVNPRGVIDPPLAGAVPLPAPPPAPLWRRAMPVTGAALAAAAVTAAIFVATRPVPPPLPVSRFVIPYGEGQVRTITSRPSLAISPDGARVAYPASREIYVRELRDLQAHLVSRGASANLAASAFSLVFSPDGRSIAYWDQADERIKRIELSGGAPVLVCPAPQPLGIAWHGDALYFPAQGGMRRVPASGGEPEIIIASAPNEVLTTPQVLEDGRLLFSVSTDEGGSSDRWTTATVVVQRPGDTSRTTLTGGSDPRYLPSGHLVYQSGGVLFARTFDPQSNVVGNATAMVEGVLRGANTTGAGLAWYGVSSNGTLIYIPGPVGAVEQDVRLAWFNRAGQPDFLPTAAGPYLQPRVSPDGKRIAFVRSEKDEFAVWVQDLAAGAAARRLTFGGRDRFPVWSHDGRAVIFQSDREGDAGIFWQRADGVAERLTTAAKDEAHVPGSISPDGAVLLFDRMVGGVSTLMAYSFKDRTSTPYGGVTSQTMTGPVFSPDGKWATYSAREKGQTTNYTYVQPYPATGAKYQISTSKEDGHHQVWSADGRELFYTPGPGALLTAVRITTTPAFSFAPGDPVARPFANNAPQTARTFDVGGPGVRFLGLIPPGATEAGGFRTDIHVVLNWFEELRARVK